MERLLEELAQWKTDLHGKDFLWTWERTLDEIRAIATAAEVLQALHRAGASLRVFESGLAISIFRDQSTRTRFSFAAAANLLGLAVADLDEEKSQVSHGETVRETANMISFLTEVIGIRDDKFLREGNAYMREVAQAVQEGYDQGVLPQRPTLVNLQCDVDHPTQSMADLLHLKRHFGSFEALRGKRLAMTWAYSPSYGKPLSVPQGIIGLMTRFGMEVTLAYPEGYDLLPEVVDLARRQAGESGVAFRVVHSMDVAFEGAHVVYPKSWAPFRVMERRTELLHRGDREGLKELEKEALAENARHADWECDEARMARTAGGEALYMHCLPADISGVSCRQGEVSATVFEKARLGTYREAGYKPCVSAAMMLAARFPDLAGTVRGLADRNRARIGL